MLFTQFYARVVFQLHACECFVCVNKHAQQKKNKISICSLILCADFTNTVFIGKKKSLTNLVAQSQTKDMNEKAIYHKAKKENLNKKYS